MGPAADFRGDASMTIRKFRVPGLNMPQAFGVIEQSTTRGVDHADSIANDVIEAITTLPVYRVSSARGARRLR
jgi:hypothetical protein